MNKFTLSADTFTSRTFWTALTVIATAATTLTGPQRILGILSGLATIFVRDAISNTAATQPTTPTTTQAQPATEPGAPIGPTTTNQTTN